MTKLLKSACGAAFALALAAQPAFAKEKPAPATTAPAAAQAPSSTVISGIAVADLGAVIANSDAARIGDQQRPVTYKAQIDAYQSRGRALQAQIQPLVDKLKRDAAAPNANQAVLQQQANSIQKLQDSGQQELNGIIQPVLLSREYVKEQIEEKLDEAVKAAMKKRGITLLLSPQAVIAIQESSYDLTAGIIAEVNTLLPTAQLVPPTGWMPREQREEMARQQAAQQAQQAPQGQAAAPARPAQPAGPQPDGR